MLHVLWSIITWVVNLLWIPFETPVGAVILVVLIALAPIMYATEVIGDIFHGHHHHHH